MSRQIEATASFLEPCQFAGNVTAVDLVGDTSDGVPYAIVALDNGVNLRVNAVQKDLLFKLAIANPKVGDRIRVIYQGDTDRAAPGMSPTKIFRVDVRPAGTQPPDRPSGLGEVAGENGPEAGQ